MKSVEQDARDILERMGVEDAQAYSSGDLVELANLLNELYDFRASRLNILEKMNVAEQSMQSTGSSIGHIVATCECEICRIMRHLPKDTIG